MNAKLTANGKTIDYEISDAEYHRLFKRTGLEKPKIGEWYYLINFNGAIYSRKWLENQDELAEYAQGDILTDEKLAHDRLKARKIKTKLERFAAEHNKGALNWTCNDEYKYYLSYNYYHKSIIICDCNSLKTEGVTYFNSEKIAEQAIGELDKDGELTWYLGSYQPWIGSL